MYKKRSLKELYRLAKGESSGCCDNESKAKEGCTTEEAPACCDAENKNEGCSQ